MWSAGWTKKVFKGLAKTKVEIRLEAFRSVRADSRFALAVYLDQAATSTLSKAMRAARRAWKRHVQDMEVQMATMATMVVCLQMMVMMDRIMKLRPPKAAARVDGLT